METNIQIYERIRSGGTGFHEQKRGLISVHGKEAAQFLNGMITNDVAKLEDGGQMLAAFPNSQGRLIAVVRVLRQDDKFLFETEEATHAAVYQNLFRFTFAGDFFVEDLSEDHRFFTIFDRSFLPAAQHLLEFESRAGNDLFVRNEEAEGPLTELRNVDAVEVPDDVYETLRIEIGIPKYGVDMDETTIVPEIGLDDLISYNKGCYIGQEIIARIHFRGHVAKQLTGLILDSLHNTNELASTDGKNAGRITSSVFSPKLQKNIALAYVRYDYLPEGTELKVGDHIATVKNLPFI
jgi:tRNA-modifying protein YgfZ